MNINLAESLDVLASNWVDTPEFHERAIIDFDNAVIAVPELAAHRKWVEDEKFGFGHRAFSGVFHLLAKELPDNFKFLEIGVHRGYSISCVDLASQLESKDCTVIGISPLNGVGGFYELKDYQPDVDYIFSKFNGSRRPILWRGLSQDEHIKKLTLENAPYDAIYVDGCHEYLATKHDLEFYSPLIKQGGYLIADDAAMNLQLFSWGFKGFEGSSRACDEFLPPFTPNKDWQHVGAIMHLRLWKKL